MVWLIIIWYIYFGGNDMIIINEKKTIQEIIAIDADMHFELADLLKEQRGSKEIYMW